MLFLYSSYRRSLVRSPVRPIVFPRTDDSQSDRIHSFAFYCSDDGYVGKQTVFSLEYCADYWLKELWESIDRCTGRHDITEILFKNGVKSHTINHTAIVEKFTKDMDQDRTPQNVWSYLDSVHRLLNEYKKSRQKWHRKTDMYVTMASSSFPGLVNFQSFRRQPTCLIY